MNTDVYYTAPDYDDAPPLILNDATATALQQAHEQGIGMSDDLLERVRLYMARRNEKQFVRFHSAEVEEIK